MTGEAATGEYWSSYYRGAGAPQLPSQFALFVANELATGELGPVEAILGLGCGNGRDALFFLRLGYRYGGIDQSAEAIATCHARLSELGATAQAQANFIAGKAENPARWLELAAGISGPVLVYARFFFHAVSEAVEDQVLDNACGLLARGGGALCVEARTVEDRAFVKATPEHYRRYIEPEKFTAKLARRGLELRYQAAGRGFAKFRRDDADVFRVIASP